MWLFLLLLQLVGVSLAAVKCGRKKNKKRGKSRTKTPSKMHKSKSKTPGMTPTSTSVIKKTTKTIEVNEFNQDGLANSGTNSGTIRPKLPTGPELEMRTATVLEEEKPTDATTGSGTTASTTVTTNPATTTQTKETEPNEEELHRCRDYTPAVFKDLGHLFDLLKD